ncbi:MAG: dinitrogenase iron-molybdenum cofactor biosynthesis protein [Pseudomonadota bacterium]
MNTASVGSRDVALRIGMAARTLPGVDLRAFIGALGERYGVPLTEEGLTRVTVADLKAILQGDEIVDPGMDGESLKAAVRHLWGEGIAGGDLPVPEPYAEGDLPGSLRVAVASNSGQSLDGHFGSCVRFLVYQVGLDAVRLIDVRSTLDADESEDKNAARAAMIGDCHILYVQSIGGPAAAKVVRAGAHPIKVPSGGEVLEVLPKLQEAMQSPPPWLARVMGVEAASLARFTPEDDEEDGL